MRVVQETERKETTMNEKDQIREPGRRGQAEAAPYLPNGSPVFARRVHGREPKAATTTGTLLDWCPAGPILLIADARTILAWERLALIELAGD